MNPQRFIVESPPITTSCWTFIVTEYLTSVLHRREKSTVTFNTDTDSKYSTPNIESLSRKNCGGFSFYLD